jgi:pilus assembly protein CpaB
MASKESKADKPAKKKSGGRFAVRPITLGLAVGAAGVGATLLYMREFEAHATGGHKVSLLATTKPIHRGSLITADMLATREIPQAYVDDRAVRSSDKGRIIALRATNNIAVGQTIEWTDVIAPSDGQRDLASLVQPGNRALPLHVTSEDSLALIQPGDFVDIIAVVNGESTVLLQRVLVLAAGLNTRADSPSETTAAPSAGGTTITVNVSIAQGQLLTLAMERGKLTALVRNPEDQHVADTAPPVNDSALIDPSKRREFQQRRRPVAAAPVHLGVTQ